MPRRQLTPPKQALTITPAPSAMAKLQRLHAAVGLLAEEAPEITAHPEAARGLEQALIEAMVGALANREEHDDSLARGQHAIVMRRFRGVVEESPEEPLYIPEICKAIRVSERTLRICCQEYLGMGPKRYLLLRRMHLVRQALRQAATDDTSVTEIATRYGFWHLGRFAEFADSSLEEAVSSELVSEAGSLQRISSIGGSRGASSQQKRALTQRLTSQFPTHPNREFFAVLQGI
jgi:AraC-like DNA-binding protein